MRSLRLPENLRESRKLLLLNKLLQKKLNRKKLLRKLNLLQKKLNRKKLQLNLQKQHPKKNSKQTERTIKRWATISFVFAKTCDIVLLQLLLK